MISVIVPVYNAEKYLSRCIDSILAQSYKDFELLLIDDGSKDGSATICDNYAIKDSRVRVFHKANGGVSSARNLGLDNATGEWITFIDSDDYVHTDFLSSLYKKHDVDLIVGSFQLVGSDENWNGVLEDSYFDRLLIEKHIDTLAMQIHYRTPWAKLFRAEVIFVNHLSFEEKIHSSEDWLFVLNYLIYTHSLIVSSSPYYFYERSHVDGLSQNSRHFSSYFYAMEAFHKITDVLVSTFGNKMKSIYIESVRGYCSRQCRFLYYSDESIFKKIRKLRVMFENEHLEMLCRYDVVRWRKKIRIFHFLMSKKFLFMALIYIHIFKGKIYT